MSLEDVGRKVMFYPDSMRHEPSEKEVIMVIKAPRGEMRLFDYVPHRQWREPAKEYQDHQCEAIRAFTEEHRND